MVITTPKTREPKGNQRNEFIDTYLYLTLKSPTGIKVRVSAFFGRKALLMTH
jgi:hypothetical protein